MFGVSIAKICELCDGTPYFCPDMTKEPERLVIDSREVRNGDIFAAFVGENTDGHKYISSACSNGALCCLVEYIPADCTAPCILVDSVEHAMALLAEYVRERLSIPVVGITGSVGKTTAKEMIYSVLKHKYKVLKTDKNLNNQLGVPITISRIEKDNTAAVVEMGVSKIGDMALLGSIVRPTVAVFTNIGHAHLEFLHSLKGVFDEKTAMLNYMDESGVAVVNNDDELLRGIVCRQKKISYGIENEADITAYDIEYTADGCGSSFIIKYGDNSFRAYVPSFGKHIVYASLMASAVGFALGMSCDEIKEGLKEFKTVGRRAAVYKMDTLTLIDDCYNANPDSVKNSIASMKTLKGRHVCVLGDMLELGPDSCEMHRDVGIFAAENGADFLILAGCLSQNTYDGAVSAGCKAIYYPTRDELLDNIMDLIQPGDDVLVKASLGSGFDKVSEKIKQIFG